MQQSGTKQEQLLSCTKYGGTGCPIVLQMYIGTYIYVAHVNFKSPPKVNNFYLAITIQTVD